MQPTVPSGKRSSPFFRDYGATAESNPVKASPLLSDTSNARYQKTVLAPATQNSQRRSLLPKTFMEDLPPLPAKDSTRTLQAHRSIPSTSSGHGSSATSLPHLSNNAPSIQCPAPKPIIPKNSVLTRLEKANSWSILTIIFLPALVSLTCYLGAYTWKYASHTILCSTHTPSLCSVYKDTFVFQNITNVHSLLRMGISGASLVHVRELKVMVKLHTQTTPANHTHTQTHTQNSGLLYTHTLDTSGSLDSVSYDGVTTYIIFSSNVYVYPYTYTCTEKVYVPLPYIDLAYHVSDLTPCTVSVYITMSSSPYTSPNTYPYTYPYPSLTLETHTLTLPYIYTVLILKCICILVCLVTCLTCITTLWAEAEAGSRAPRDSLPFVFASHLTPYVFILPEQYGMCMGCMVYGLYLVLTMMTPPPSPLPTFTPSLT
ncbi:hypothetical protein EON65_18630, partial [archaeon]